MPIIETLTSTVLHETSITNAFPHEEGILLLRRNQKVAFSYEWHDGFGATQIEQWPFLDVRKTVADSEGESHACSSFVGAEQIVHSINGKHGYSERAFLDRFDDYEFRPLTDFVEFYCDSRECLVFLFHDSPSVSDFVVSSHFDKHSGGSIRLLDACPYFFLELRLGRLDDRIGGIEIEANEPLFFDIDLDQWSNWNHARNPGEFQKWCRMSSLVSAHSPVSTVFAHVKHEGDPQSNVLWLREPWSSVRARELMIDEIQFQEKERKERIARIKRESSAQ